MIQSKIALVTVLYNSGRHLEMFFQSLAAQDSRAFLLVAVDNSSPDDSARITEELSAFHGIECHLLRASENLGVAEANNRGIRAARELGCEHIVISNNDISLPPNTIRYLHEAVIAAGIEAWSPKALLGDQNTPWYVGGYLSKWRARGMHYKIDPTAKSGGKPMVVSYAPTCFLYVHAPVLDRIGMMDSLYFVYYDDTDFCKRMQDEHVTLVYDPNLVIRHYAGGSSGGDLGKVFLRINTRNKFYYIWKHYNGMTWGVVLLLAIVGKCVQLLMPKRSAGVWQGMKEGLQMVCKVRSEERLISLSR